MIAIPPATLQEAQNKLQSINLSSTSNKVFLYVFGIFIILIICFLIYLGIKIWITK